MADIIDIRSRRRRVAREQTAAYFRIRLCGPGLRWIGLVGGIVAGGLEEEGFLTAFEDLQVEDGGGNPGGLPPVVDLCAGRPAPTAIGQSPGLVVAGTPLPLAALQGGNDRTVILYGGDGQEPTEDRQAFSGLIVPLPVAGPAPEPFEMAVACAAGAARLLGVIGWRALEQALRGEVILAEGMTIDRPLALAFEAYQRLAPWTAVVPGEACG